MRKLLAAAMHMACLALFWVLVVWPVAGPMASGELAREFGPVLCAVKGEVARLAGGPRLESRPHHAGGARPACDT
jgi:hypothetical protein